MLTDRGSVQGHVLLFLYELLNIDAPMQWYLPVYCVYLCVYLLRCGRRVLEVVEEHSVNRRLAGWLAMFLPWPV